MSMAVFRPAFTEKPRLISEDESHPPATLPTSEITHKLQVMGAAICIRVKP